MSNRAVAIIREHPAGSAIGAIVLVLIFMFLFKGGSSGSSSGTAAYYQALQAQTAAGNAIQLEKMSLDAQTNQETIAANYALQGEQIKSGDTRYQIDSNERLGMATLNEEQFQTATQHAIADNLVNLQNATLHSNEIINAQNVSAQKKASHNGLLGSIFGSIASVASSVLPFAFGL